MKKALLIIILFIGIGTVYAQSDATWEETIDWTNSKLKEGGEFHRVESNKKVSCEINHNGAIIKHVNAKCHWTYSANIHDLISIKIATNEKREFYLKLIFSQDLVISQSEDCNFFSKDNSISIYTKNKESAERLKKALDRLLTLKKTERDKEKF